MNSESYPPYEKAKEVLNQILRNDGQKDLTKLEEDISRKIYEEDKNYDVIALELNYTVIHCKQTGKNLWDRLSRAFAKKGIYIKLSKTNFRKWIKDYIQITASVEGDEGSKMLISLEEDLESSRGTILEGASSFLERLSQLEGGLQELSGDSISININVPKRGSIELIAKGHKEDIDRLCSRIESGDLKQLNGFRIVGYKLAEEESVVQPSRRRDSLGRSVIVSKDVRQILSLIVIAVVVFGLAIIAHNNWSSIVLRTEEIGKQLLSPIVLRTKEIGKQLLSLIEHINIKIKPHYWILSVIGGGIYRAFIASNDENRSASNDENRSASNDENRRR